MTPKQRVLKEHPTAWCEDGQWSDPDGPAWLIMALSVQVAYRPREIVTIASGDSPRQAWADAAANL